MFDSILPNQPSQTPTLPPSLLAWLKGTPITGALATNLATTPPAAPSPMGGGPTPPAPTPAGASQGPGPGLVLPKGIPAGPALPLPSPAAAGFDAAARGAASGQVFDSPLATLASSVLRGISAGLPAFRARRQANKEAEYMQNIQNAIQKSSDDYVNNDANFSSFGVRGKNLQAALKALPLDVRYKVLENNQLWAPPKISGFGNGGLYNETTGEVVRQPDGKPVPEGEAVPLVDPKTGQPVLDDKGQPKYFTPNPKKEKPYQAAEHAGEFYNQALDTLYHGLDPNDPSIDAKKVSDLAQKLQAQHDANSRTVNVEDTVGKGLASQAAQMAGTRAESAVQTATALPQLYDAYDKVDAINAGITGPLKQLWGQLRGSKSAQLTQEYAADIMGTIIPSLKGTGLGRITNTEIELLKKAAGGNLTDQNAALKTIVGNVIQRGVSQIQDNNTRAAALTGKYPELAGQFQVQVPTRVRVRNGVEQHYSWETRKWYAPDASGQWKPVGDQ